MTYSQAKQDLWVISLFEKGHKGIYFDMGCYDPRIINNTLLLEMNGWEGYAFDICDYSDKWKNRTTKFIHTDLTTFDFKNCGLPKMVDYLSLDIDVLGNNILVMRNLIKSGFKFKAITIEHNLYEGDKYNEQERIPQRVLLLSEGYLLTNPDVEFEGRKFEDWWINPRYI